MCPDGVERVCVHLLVAVLLLQHDGQSLQEGPHAWCHVEADHALLLQGSAARGQHVTGRHELLGAVHHQHVLRDRGRRDSYAQTQR